ncbi:MAG: hypothetical protein C7B46_16985 [Sulfobacillus benefaciens]|uniref:Uncharacterized protein n=1 Tax=Sulfobacillus benefaciens TaxID=453960 RepID=A0A2T2XA57_9FIRM|nr:MAG: hypothetical protein C7B46_16985 [Sulfobacillus benefaciens]
MIERAIIVIDPIWVDIVTFLTFFQAKEDIWIEQPLLGDPIIPPNHADPAGESTVSTIPSHRPAG